MKCSQLANRSIVVRFRILNMKSLLLEFYRERKMLDYTDHFNLRAVPKLKPLIFSLTHLHAKQKRNEKQVSASRRRWRSRPNCLRSQMFPACQHYIHTFFSGRLPAGLFSNLFTTNARFGSGGS